MVNAAALLDAIETGGCEMKLPNIYTAPAKGNLDKVYTIDLARYFVGGEDKTYTCTIANSMVATATVEGTVLKVAGVAEGVTTAVITVDGAEHVVTVTVRNNANNSGWL